MCLFVICISSFVRGLFKSLAHFLSLLLGLPDDMNVRSFVIVPHVSEALIIFFFSLFSHCYSDRAISNVLSSSSLIFFLVFSILLMILIHWFAQKTVVSYLSILSRKSQSITRPAPVKSQLSQMLVLLPRLPHLPFSPCAAASRHPSQTLEAVSFLAK